VDFFTSFFLTNPKTVISFCTVLAVAGLGVRRPLWLKLLLVGGVFAGSMAWRIVLQSDTNPFRSNSAGAGRLG